MDPASGCRKGAGRAMNFFRTMLLLAAMTALFMAVGYLIGGTGGMMIAFLFAVGTNAFAYWNSDKMVLRMHNAEPVTRASAPELHEMVGRLAQRASLPMPKVYIIREQQPNAFATGRNPENAAVAATTGILELLRPDELEGVIAHELAHIKNRDILTMTVAATVAGAISMLAQFGFFFGAGRDRDNPMGPLGMILAVHLRAAGGDAHPDDDQPHPGIFRRPAGGGDQRQAAGARERARQDLGLRPAHRHADRRAQPGLGAALHHQPAERAADGQPLLHPSERGEPHPRARGDGRPRRRHRDRGTPELDPRIPTRPSPIPVVRRR